MKNYLIKNKFLNVALMIAIFILSFLAISVLLDTPEHIQTPVWDNAQFWENLAKPESTETYAPQFSALNIKETMTLTPMFTPDTAIHIHEYWLDQANTTIDIQNQYITHFDSCAAANDDVPGKVACWATDSSPIMRGIVDAHNDRGVTVRVQVNEGGDSDFAVDYLQSVGIDVRWMGSMASSGDYLSDTHNKLVIIDDKVTLLSSINFGENAFKNNREAGMVMQSATVAAYYKSIFDFDWAAGEIPPLLTTASSTLQYQKNTDTSKPADHFISHTDIPVTNFTGSYNVTLFTNPDNADEVIFEHLIAAKESVYVSMYTISREDFEDTLIDLKNANPAMDIQVLISNRRVGGSENVATNAAATKLVANLIPVYNSTKDDNSVDGFYHNKYWILDGKHVFVYSGNWSPRSVTPKLEAGDPNYTSSEGNRDMGVAVHDAPDIAAIYKNVWDQDVAVASAWELPVGISQTAFEQAEIVSGSINIAAQVGGIENGTVSYRWGSGSFTEVTATNGTFSESFDSTTLDNGITTFEVKVEKDAQSFTDSVDVNVVNIAASDNFRVLITEVYPNPDPESDTEGEFIEVTNSFPFDVLLEGWQVGDDSKMHTFGIDFTIEAYSSIIIARDLVGFEAAQGIAADIELSVSLKNSDDVIQLLDGNGDFVDVVAYGVAAPDGSDAMEAPEAGETLQRDPLHVDTDTANDWAFGSPNPKASVPSTPLNGDSTTASIPWVAVLIALPLLPLFKRKQKYV